MRMKSNSSYFLMSNLSTFQMDAMTMRSRNIHNYMELRFYASSSFGPRTGFKVKSIEKQWLPKFHLWVSAPWEQIRTSELKTVFNVHILHVSFTSIVYHLLDNHRQHHADHARLHHCLHPLHLKFIPHASSSFMLHFSNLGIPHDQSSPRADSRTWSGNVGRLTLRLVIILEMSGSKNEAL